MRRLRALLLAGIPLLLFPAGSGARPSDFHRPRWSAPETTVGRWPARFGLDAGIWSSDWNLRVTTAAETKRIKGPVQWFAPRIDLPLAEAWTASFRWEIGESDRGDLSVLAAHLSRPVLDLGDAVVEAHAGPAYGMLDAHRFPGDFDNAFGLDLGLDGIAEVTPGWTLRLSATFRYMTFDYERSPEVLDASDHRVGTGGLLVSAGFSYRF